MILVAVDTEGCAWDVVEHAAKLAADLGTEAFITTSVEVPQGIAAEAVLHGQYEGQSAAHLLVHDAKASLQGLASVFENLGVPVKISVRAGSPVKAVLACVQEMRPRFLVVGTHGRTGIKRMVLGSVAEQIIRQCSVPVLVVRSSGEGWAPRIARDAIRAEADG